MRNQKEIWYNTFVIVSEPGDGSIYEYMVYRCDPDHFRFMPMNSTFVFPQRLSYDECLAIEKHSDNYISRAETWHCKVDTLKECIRTVKILHERPMK